MRRRASGVCAYGAFNLPKTVIRRPSTDGSQSVFGSEASTSHLGFEEDDEEQSPIPRRKTVSLTVAPNSPHTVRYALPVDAPASRRNSVYSYLGEKKQMDFDPNGTKWQCCCCTLPTGLRFLAAGEIMLSSIVAALTGFLLLTDKIEISWFTGCLLTACLSMCIGSILLFAGIQTHQYQLLYPTLVARTLLVMFFTMFCGSVITSPHSETGSMQTATISLDEETGHWRHKHNLEAASESLALRLVGLVFAMLFFAVLVLYTVYLVLRCAQYERSFARLRERRESLIQAGMIDPELSDCRRPSNC